MKLNKSIIFSENNEKISKVINFIKSKNKINFYSYSDISLFDIYMNSVFFHLNYIKNKDYFYNYKDLLNYVNKELNLKLDIDENFHSFLIKLNKSDKDIKNEIIIIMKYDSSVTKEIEEEIEQSIKKIKVIFYDNNITYNDINFNNIFNKEEEETIKEYIEDNFKFNNNNIKNIISNKLLNDFIRADDKINELSNIKNKLNNLEEEIINNFYKGNIFLKSDLKNTIKNEVINEDEEIESPILGYFVIVISFISILSFVYLTFF